MKFKNILTMAMAACLMLPAAANAETKLDEDGIPYSSKYMKGAPHASSVALVRSPDLTEDQFILQLTDEFPVSGCADLSDYAYTAEYRDSYLDISVDSLTIDMRDQPQYAHIQCDRSMQVPKAELVINRSDMIKHEVKAIRLHNGYAQTYYKVDMNEDRVKIMPDIRNTSHLRKFEPKNNPNRKTSLVYWFYPVGTVILWSPQIEKANDGQEKLEKFATAKGLVPLGTLIPDFKSPLRQSDYFYYVDTEGRFTDNGKDMADGVQIGDIEVEKTVYGLEKDEIELDKIAVYARTPGKYD